ncbi:MAG: hypothetical protein FJ291_23590 [Planctomycetes bacterium]|nr:hypothetical protein [Planctomycetota bacterium]
MGGRARASLPLAAKMLVGYALLLAAQRAVDAADGRLFDLFSGLPWHKDLAAEAVAPYVAYAAIVVAGIAGVALRQRWGLVLFALSWGADYLISLGVRLPLFFGRSADLDGPPGLRLGVLAHLVVVNGLFAAFAIAYAASAALRRAVLGSGAPAMQWAPQPPPPARLPLAAKLLAVQKTVGNAAAIVFWVQKLPMFADTYGSPGMRSPLSFLSLLDQLPYARPAASILVALAGIVGAAMLFLRRHWGLWLLIGAGCIQALPNLGYWLALPEMARGFGHERLLSFRVHWDMVIGIALILAHLAFEIAYLCDTTVREAMVTEGDE